MLKWHFGTVTPPSVPSLFQTTTTIISKILDERDDTEATKKDLGLSVQSLCIYDFQDI
jgi:hypothetical protein